MNPYGQHKPFKECHCEMCRRGSKKVKAKKKAERQRAHKEIRHETSKTVKDKADL